MNFLFLQCLEENVLGETSGWFIDPLEELFGIYMGVPPYPLFVSETEKSNTVNELSLFLFSFFYNDLMRMSSARPRGGSSIHWKNLQLRF